jgi:hypothetical protein
MGLWCRGLTCLPVTQEIAGSNPVSPVLFMAAVVKWLTRWIVAPVFEGSIPSGRPFFSYTKQFLLGSSQVVRHRFLVPCTEGSNPSSPVFLCMSH